jgi:hypothetical protein
MCSSSRVAACSIVPVCNSGLQFTGAGTTVVDHECVLSTAVQIHPGHAVLEGRKPALLDSLVQVGGGTGGVGGWMGTTNGRQLGAGTVGQCWAEPHAQYGMRVRDVCNLLSTPGVSPTDLCHQSP